MDRIVRLGPDAFRLAGRHDDMVQVGGVTVSPTVVAGHIRARPGVRDATVRSMRPDEGKRLKAFPVPDDGIDAETLRDGVAARALAHLPVAARPTAFTVARALPLTPLGKAADW